MNKIDLTGDIRYTIESIIDKKLRDEVSGKDYSSDLMRLVDAKVGFNDLNLALSKVKEKF